MLYSYWVFMLDSTHQDIVPGSETVLQGKYTMCGWERCFELSLNGGWLFIEPGVYLGNWEQLCNKLGSHHGILVYSWPLNSCYRNSIFEILYKLHLLHILLVNTYYSTENQNGYRYLWIHDHQPLAHINYTWFHQVRLFQTPIGDPLFSASCYSWWFNRNNKKQK